ncbi:hypothetical protein DPMN_024764 [Dreissena polymorpha]|uniref:Uncharacterized protein n=1 Tax=Dreissena polymorpha TaxID=45954 RepID=A0A9D4LQD3_DREPO|nr:hypothetical protein DPMN_024764 [Dreissena polymorpha]
MDNDTDQWLKIMMSSPPQPILPTRRSWPTRPVHVRRLRRTTTKRMKKKRNRYMRCHPSLQAVSKVSNGWRPLHTEHRGRRVISAASDSCKQRKITKYFSSHSE